MQNIVEERKKNIFCGVCFKASTHPEPHNEDAQSDQSEYTAAVVSLLADIYQQIFGPHTEKIG